MSSSRGRHVAAAAAGLALVLGGCAPMSDWLQDRGGDLADVLPVHLVAAAGADLKLEATNFLALGAGWYEGWAFGLADRRLGSWDEKVGDIGIVMGLFNHHWEVVTGVPRVSGDYDFNILAPAFNRPMYDTTAPGFLSWCTLRATAVVLVGFDAQLRLGEVADFFAGLAGYDPSHDDTSARRYSASSGW